MVLKSTGFINLVGSSPTARTKIAASSNGRTADFESAYLRSSRSAASKERAKCHKRFSLHPISIMGIVIF